MRAILMPTCFRGTELALAVPGVQHFTRCALHAAAQHVPHVPCDHERPVSKGQRMQHAHNCADLKPTTERLESGLFFRAVAQHLHVAAGKRQCPEVYLALNGGTRTASSGVGGPIARSPAPASPCAFLQSNLPHWTQTTRQQCLRWDARALDLGLWVQAMWSASVAASALAASWKRAGGHMGSEVQPDCAVCDASEQA